MDTIEKIEALAREGKGKEAISLAEAQKIEHKKTVDAMVRGRTSVPPIPDLEVHTKDREGN